MLRMLVIFRFIMSLILGVTCTMVYAKVLSKKNIPKIIGVGLFILVLEIIIIELTTPSIALDLYPLHTHLILILFLVLIFKCKIAHSILYVTLAYMNCFPVVYLSRLAGYIWPDSLLAEYLFYFVFVILMIICVNKYVAFYVSQLIGISRKNDIAFLIIPVIFYFFDFFVNVWSDLLMGDNYHILQFMPFVVCVVYLVVIRVISGEMQNRIKAFEEQCYMEEAISVISKEMEGLQESENMSRIYRHDMRHHFAMIRDFIENGNVEEAKIYIKENIDVIADNSLHRYCDVEIVNLVLSGYEKRGRNHGLHTVFDVDLPKNVALKSTDICAILSAILDNVFSKVEDLKDSFVKLKMSIFQDMFIITVEAPCSSEVALHYWSEGMSDEERDISIIVKNQGGEVYFAAKDELYKVMATIPLTV